MHREYRPEEMGMGLPSSAHDDDHGHDHDHDPDAERRMLVGVTVVVGLLLVADLVLGYVGSPWQRPFGVPLALIGAVIGGGRVVYLAILGLCEKSIGADVALAIACVAAACLGEYFVAAEVVFIALLGECLEAFAFERARRAIGSLLDVYPRTARVIRDGVEIEVAERATGRRRSRDRPTRRADRGRRLGRWPAVRRSTRRSSPARACPWTKGKATPSSPAPSTSSAGSRSGRRSWAPRRRSARSSACSPRRSGTVRPSSGRPIAMPGASCPPC